MTIEEYLYDSNGNGLDKVIKELIGDMAGRAMILLASFRNRWSSLVATSYFHG